MFASGGVPNRPQFELHLNPYLTGFPPFLDCITHTRRPAFSWVGCVNSDLARQFQEAGLWRPGEAA